MLFACEDIKTWKKDNNDVSFEMQEIILYMKAYSDWNELSFVKFVQFQFFNLTLIRYSRELARNYFMILLENADPSKLKLPVVKELV